jgi:hypothetical protein
MRWLAVLVAGAALVIAAAFWVSAQVSEAHEHVRAFCTVLRPGQPWAELEKKSTANGFVVSEGLARGSSREYLVEQEAFSHTFACTLDVENGHLREARFAELPR